MGGGIGKDKTKLIEAVRKIEDTVSLIRNEGKMAYIQNTEDDYCRVYHDYIDVAMGFEKWKGEMVSVMS